MSTIAMGLQIRSAALSQGRELKRVNAATALFCGAIPGLIISRFLHMSVAGWVIGIAVGLLWANAFEYVYHRFLLHSPKSSFGKGHLLHHLTTGKPEEPEHVTFGSSPMWVAALFAINGCIALAIEWCFRLGIAPGILTGFSLYLMIVEEIHWRIHLGGWLPPGLEWAREYHLAHHDIPGGRFNVFFPVFDLLFGNIHPPLRETEAATMAAASFVWTHEERAGLSWAASAVLWMWMAGLFVGARYFWTTSPKP